MFQQIVPVNKDRHAGKKILPVSDFRFAAKHHIAYLTLHEFVRAASTYPVLFLEDKANDDFRPVALLGLTAGENAFVGEDGQWQAGYIPAIIRRYPFALSQSGEDDRFLVCVDALLVFGILLSRSCLRHNNSWTSSFKKGVHVRHPCWTRHAKHKST